MGHTENKILLAKVWQKPNTYQLNCDSQTLAWQSVARNQKALGDSKFLLKPQSNILQLTHPIVSSANK
jgi:hypothetical protein